MRALLLLILIGIGRPTVATPVTFILTLDASDTTSFVDGYPLESSLYPPYRRLFSVQTDATAEVRAGSIVRLKFASPLVIRLKHGDQSTSSLLPYIDLRLDLAQLAAFTKFDRIESTTVAVREKLGAWTFGNVLAYARTEASRQPLADDVARLPELLALDHAVLALGHLPFRPLSRGEIVAVDRMQIRAPRLPGFDSGGDAVVPVDAATFARIELYDVRDRRVARYLDLLRDIRAIQKRASKSNVVRPKFGRSVCIDDFL